MEKKEKLPLDQAWENWLECLYSDDTNSIINQIGKMLYDTAIFRVIITARQVKIKKNPEDPELNISLHAFIDRNYFRSQLIYIRALIGDSYGLTDKKGVFSIPALIKNIESYREELTREKYFDLLELPYDYSDEEQVKIFFKNDPLEEYYAKNPVFNINRCTEAHEHFDFLSRTDPSNRNHNDLINEQVFTRLEKKIASGTKIKTIVDKYIAHASSPESRSSWDHNNFEITFEEILKLHETIFSVADFISFYVLSQSQISFPTIQTTFYKYWEKPLFEKEETSLIRTTLEKYQNDARKWKIYRVKDVWQWLGA